MLKIHASPGSAETIRKVESGNSLTILALDGLARTILVLAIIVCPWLMGGYETRVQFGLYIAVTVVLAVWILSSTVQAFSNGVLTNRIPSVVLPLVGLYLLGCCQLLPSFRIPPAEEIQSAVETASSPSAAESERWQQSRSALIRSLQTGGSIAPAATRFELARLTVAITVFFLSTQLFASSSTQPWLWGALAVNGAVLSFFGVCQQLSWNEKLFWSFPLKHGGSPFSSFVNRNNAAGYLCLCLAAGLGWLLYTFSRTNYWHSDYEQDAQEPQWRPRRSLLLSISTTINELTFSQMLSVTSVFLLATGVILAMSRGGWLALVSATIVTAIMTNRGRQGRNLVLITGIAVSIAALIFWFGLGERLRQRWRAIPSVASIYQEGRIGHWSDAIRIIPDFPGLGTGYGTYQFAYLPYQTHPELAQLRFYNADNQFLEWAVEGGVGGISLVALVLLLTTGSIFALRKNRFDPAGTVGVFAVVSQVVSATFDFGPTMPANMLALSAVFGALTGRAALMVNFNRMNRPAWGLTLPRLKPLFLIPAFGVGLFFFNWLGLQELKAASAVHTISRHLPPMNTAQDLDEPSVDRLIQQLSDAIQNYPDDPDAHLALADLWIYKFRLKEFQKDSDKSDNAAAWLETHPSLLYRKYNQWHSAEQFEFAEMLLENPELQTCLRPAYSHLQQSLRACPLMPDVGAMLATLQFVVTPDTPSGEEYLRKALTTGPSSRSTFFQIGQLANFAGLTAFSQACWKRSLQLGPQFLREIHAIAATTLPLDEELDKVIPPSGEVLIELAQSYQNAGQESERTLLCSKAIEILSQNSSGADEAKTSRLMGKAYLLEGKPEDAVQAYQHALELSPNQIEWRIELVQLLADFRGLPWALREAETCAALAPDRKPLQDMVQDLRKKIADGQTSKSTGRKVH